MDKEERESDEIALLTRKERDWLLGKTDVSKPYEYRLRSSIRKKIQILTDIELPDLVTTLSICFMIAFILLAIVFIKEPVMNIILFHEDQSLFA
jgi:hypothetical protein